MWVVETLGVVVGLGALFYLAVIDFKHKIIPNKALLALLMARIILYLTQFAILYPRRVDYAAVVARGVLGALSTRWIFHVDCYKVQGRTRGRRRQADVYTTAVFWTSHQPYRNLLRVHLDAGTFNRVRSFKKMEQRNSTTTCSLHGIRISTCNFTTFYNYYPLRFSILGTTRHLLEVLQNDHALNIYSKNF
jgi:prepilin signal peptidase PulO-like enzyme (type II secretory pathway)